MSSTNDNKSRLMSICDYDDIPYKNGTSVIHVLYEYLSTLQLIRKHKPVIVIDIKRCNDEQNILCREAIFFEEYQHLIRRQGTNENGQIVLELEIDILSSRDIFNTAMEYFSKEITRLCQEHHSGFTTSILLHYTPKSKFSGKCYVFCKFHMYDIVTYKTQNYYVQRIKNSDNTYDPLLLIQKGVLVVRKTIRQSELRGVQSREVVAMRWE